MQWTTKLFDNAEWYQYFSTSSLIPFLNTFFVLTPDNLDLKNVTAMEKGLEKHGMI